MSMEPEQKKPGGLPPDRPPKLIPPDTKTAAEPAPSRLTPVLLIGAGLLLLALALFVVLVPIGSDAPKVQTVAETTPAPAPPAEQPAQGQDAAAQEAVEDLVGDWLRRQAEAEADNIAAWGGEAYLDAVALAEQCQRLLADQALVQARSSCARALEELDRLETARPVLLEKALRGGAQALDDGDADAAAGYFRQALAIDGGNAQALAGMRRAENLPRVLQFVKDGTALEGAGDADGALLAFAAAEELDPAYPPAREGRKRVEASVAGHAFQQAMSRALQALSDGRLTAADKALQQAGAIRPNDPAVRDLEQQLANRRRAVQLDSLRRETVRLEQAERWPEAMTACASALALDARATFAANCKERIDGRIELDQRLQALLTRPERLFEAAPLAAARQLLASARSIEPRGPRLAGQLERLESLIGEAEAEVEVVVKSDGLTDVSIYHVGRLGRFVEKRLVLRTGNYTATGTRKGYRDTRQTFAVRPGAGTLVFTVLCEEPI